MARGLKTIAYSVLQHTPRLRLAVRRTYWKLRRRKFSQLSASIPSNGKLVFFEAYGGKQYDCSPKALFRTLLADPRFANWEYVWSFAPGVEPPVQAHPELGQARIVTRESDEYFRALAQARYWVLNNRVPEYVYPKPEQVYVQCWHGTPLKRLGCDVAETSEGGALNTAAELAERFCMDAEKWSYLLSPSAFASKHLCSAFGLTQERRPQVVCEEGYPRNDAVVNTLAASDAAEHVARIKERLGVPADKKLLLFAPTWRDDQFKAGTGYVAELPLDLDALRAEVGGEWAIMLRMHYHIANQLDLSPWEGFAFDVSKADDISELYCAADALCTDYSSVFFDYAVTGRPLLFFWPDRAHYEKALHGFYMDADKLPGPKCATTGQLARELRAMGTWDERYGAEYQAFRQEFAPHEDGRASERVIDRVFGGAA